jgi:hypothetical protein
MLLRNDRRRFRPIDGPAYEPMPRWQTVLWMALLWGGVYGLVWMFAEIISWTI